MCYVIYTGVGREQQVKKLIDRTVPRELYTRCFYPYRHMRKKIAGSWADIYEWLIPGYLFVITDRVAEFSVALGSISRGGRYVRLLGGGKSGARAAVNAGSEATGVNADTAFRPLTPPRKPGCAECWATGGSILPPEPATPKTVTTPLPISPLSISTKTTAYASCPVP